MNIKKSALELIGKTPLLELAHYGEEQQLHARLLAKLEYLNPAGSIKDRAANYMIEAAEQSGQLKPGAVIIEPTSGNTGIGIASIAAMKGYHAILTMPETMSVERRTLLKAYGAKLVLTDGKKGMKGAIEKAKELQSEIEGSVILGQFENPANVKAHYETTGPEIWEDLEGRVDMLVAGIGTGGTITGTGTYLKEKNPDIQVVAVEPSGSPYLSKGISGSHGLQGIGAGFQPQILDTGIYDEIILVEDEDAYETVRKLAALEGILVGISSGAAIWAAVNLAKRPQNKGKTIVAILPDTGDRYLSTPVFQSGD